MTMTVNEMQFEDRKGIVWPPYADKLAEHHRHLSEVLERVCVRALAEGCGVRVDIAEGVVHIETDKAIPAGMIHEHRS